VARGWRAGSRRRHARLHRYSWTVPTVFGWTSAAGFYPFYPWGSLFLVHLRSDGTVKDELEITRDQGVTDPWNSPYAAAFGSSVANLGDLGGNGTTDLAVGGPVYPDTRSSRRRTARRRSTPTSETR